jgi:transcriptional regulator with XRE-family HTH domain
MGGYAPCVPGTDAKTVFLHIGANVRKLRLRQELTQAELAEIIECEPTYLQKVEYGTAKPSVPMLVRIANSLGVPIGALFRTTKAPEPKRGRPRKPRSTRGPSGPPAGRGGPGVRLGAAAPVAVPAASRGRPASPSWVLNRRFVTLLLHTNALCGFSNYADLSF